MQCVGALGALGRVSPPARGNLDLRLRRNYSIIDVFRTDLGGSPVCDKFAAGIFQLCQRSELMRREDELLTKRARHP
jgi:hypothetical protein